MGSFANSLHVKSDDAKEVIAAIENALQEAGYQTTDEAPAGDEAYLQTELRSLHVCQARQGWVGVLDSGLFNSAELAQELSRRLETHVLQVLVHDSDYWCYVLYRQGAELDAFNSMGDNVEAYHGGGIEELPPEFAQLLANGGLEQQMRDMQQQFEDQIPEEMRAIQTRMMTGAATTEEAQRFSEWMQSQIQHLTNILLPNMLLPNMPLPNMPLPNMPPGFPAPSDTPPIGADELKPRAEALRPLLPGAGDEGRVLEVLGKRALCAEETLCEFLRLLGIPAAFANLSYPYLEEYTDEELRHGGIIMAVQLKFQDAAVAG